MTKNEYIALRIEELEAKRTYCAQLVMNREMAHQVKICDLQIKALMAERDLVVLHAPEADGTLQDAVRHQIECSHVWNVPNGGMIQDGDRLTCEKCGAVK